MFMGLRSEPWFGPLEEELLDKIPKEESLGQICSRNIQRGKRMRIYRGALIKLSNLERQLTVAKQYVDVPNRKRSMAVFRKLHGVVKPLPFDQALAKLISRIGPVRLHTLRLFVSRPVEELADTLRDLEKSGDIARVVALQPDPTDYYSSQEDAERLMSPSRR